jgi:hypothetical protein
MTKKKLGCKQILDVGNSASRCGVCREAVQKGTGKKDFKRLKSLAIKTGVKLSDLSKEHQNELKQALKGGVSPSEILKKYLPIIADKFSKKMHGKGYMCGTGFSSVVGREFIGQAKQSGTGVFDDILGLAAWMPNPTILPLNQMVIGKTLLGLGKEKAEEKAEGGSLLGSIGGFMLGGPAGVAAANAIGIGKKAKKHGKGVRTSGSKTAGVGVRTAGATTAGIGVRTAGATTAGKGVRTSGGSQVGGEFLGIPFLPKPSQVLGFVSPHAATMAKLTGIGKPKKTSAWIMHVKKYAQDNNCTYKEAMSKAKATYVKK